jgi:hypothetical protein
MCASCCGRRRFLLTFAGCCLLRGWMRWKTFSFFWAFIWFLFFGVGILVYIGVYWCILVYIAYYLSKVDRFVYIVVKDNGMV